MTNSDIATARGPGTSKDGEALALITYVRELQEREGVYWLVVDSEAAKGALQSYLIGDRSGEGMELLYAQIAGDLTSQSKAAINIIATPSHWITRANIAANKSSFKPSGDESVLGPTETFRGSTAA